MEKALLKIERLCADELSRLLPLEDRYLQSIGEAALTAEKSERLRQAVREGRITFLVAKAQQRIVGMCSVSRCFSTFACADISVFEDFYIEPEFRGTGVARRLATAAQRWCAEQGIGSLTVACAPCDEAMYRALGFDQRLGTQYAHMTMQ